MLEQGTEVVYCAFPDATGVIIGRADGEGANRILPAGYSFVEYIQSSGTQFIDTGIIPNNRTRVVMDVQATSSAYPVCFFGARESATSCNFAFVWTGTDLRSDFCNTYTQKWAVNVLQRRIIDKNGPATTVDGVTQTYADKEFTAPKTLKLLAIDNNGTIQWQIAAKLFSCKVYTDGILVRDFVPCVSARGEFGLWDLVTECFYSNSGSGAFAGP